MVAALAGYFAKQPAADASGRCGAHRARQARVRGGRARRQIPPCATCHGKNAEGNATFPRLAGQHAPYLLKQLLVIQNALRSAPVMHGIVQELNRDQMQAVVVYLESI